MKIWFTSDTHFGSEKTIKKSVRPFKSTNAMDRKIIENWNKVVGKDDIVYHLGDFGDLENLPKLNGRIRLVMGNHERKEGLTVNELLEAGFEKVYENNTIINIEGVEINLCHEPSKHIKGMLNLFGHVHNFVMLKEFGINVGVDCHYFKPIDVEEIWHFNRIKDNAYKGELYL